MIFVSINLVSRRSAAWKMEAVRRQERYCRIMKRLKAAQFDFDMMTRPEYIGHREYLDRIFVYLTGNNGDGSRVGVVREPGFGLTLIQFAMGRLQPTRGHLSPLAMGIDVVELDDEVRIIGIDGSIKVERGRPGHLHIFSELSGRPFE